MTMKPFVDRGDANPTWTLKVEYLQTIEHNQPSDSLSAQKKITVILNDVNVIHQLSLFITN